MKLSEIKGEDAIDLWAEILAPISVILSDKKISKMMKKGEPRFKIIAEALKRHKQVVIEIMAILDRQDPATYEFNAITLPMKISEVLSDPEIGMLFGLRSQPNEEASTGSATENTGASEN